MTTSRLIAILAEAGISSVIIGGVAMRLHDSSRATQDLDLSVAATDVDKAVRTLYSAGWVLVCAVTDRGATVFGTVAAALSWIDEAAPGSLTLIRRPASLPDVPSRDVPHREIEVESQIDLLYDLAVPFGRLLHDARTVEIEGTEARCASDHHLLQLKEARRDKSAADLADIAFLRARLGRDLD
jgi:hypothetical protein